MTKKIYTSNYNRRGGSPLAISVSASAPDYFKGPRNNLLAPTWSILKAFKAGKIDKSEYARQYITLLEETRKLTPQQVFDSLPDGSILLCYEKPGDFCHRRILAAWMEEDLIIEIPEWKSEDELKKESLVDSLLEF